MTRHAIFLTKWEKGVQKLNAFFEGYFEIDQFYYNKLSMYVFEFDPHFEKSVKTDFDQVGRPQFSRYKFCHFSKNRKKWNSGSAPDHFLTVFDQIMTQFINIIALLPLWISSLKKSAKKGESSQPHEPHFKPIYFFILCRIWLNTDPVNGPKKGHKKALK